jgi:hypothetical protein
LEGIRRRSLAQVSVRVVGSEERASLSQQLTYVLRESAKGPELELLIWPGRPHFTAPSACRVLVTLDGVDPPAAVERSAHATIRIAAGQAAPEVVLNALQRLLAGQRADEPSARAA